MEQWKPIEKIPGYEVSTLGRVKKLAGEWNKYSKDIIKTLSDNKDGYKMLNWKTKDGKQHSIPVHRLVAEAFIPKVEGKDTVNHIDGNKANNEVDNLEWMNRSEQLSHAYSLGLRHSSKGSTNANAKLSTEDIQFIREHYIPRHRQYGRSALSKKYNVSYQTIWNITEYQTYKEEGSTTIPKGSTPK